MLSSFQRILLAIALLTVSVLVVMSSGTRPEPYILGGDTVEQGKIPFIARLYIKNSGRLTYCGAVIINTRHLLTAAHCLIDNESMPVGVGDVEAIVGAVDRKGENQVPGISFEKFLIHEGYTASMSILGNDIAILQTVKPILFSPSVKSIKISSSLPEEGEWLTAAGWGLIKESPDTYADVLMQVNLKVSTCTRKEYENGILCAADDSKTTCKGDSGGPLFYTNMETGEHELVGLTSYHFGHCGDLPARFTRVLAHIIWIDNKIRLMKHGYHLSMRGARN